MVAVAAPHFWMTLVRFTPSNQIKRLSVLPTQEFVRWAFCHLKFLLIEEQ